MKKPVTKADLRRELEQQINSFIAQGGEVQNFAQGESGLENGRYHRNSFVYGEPKQARTPLPDALARIDARKGPEKPKPRPQRRRKKIIYDDFGEPLREVWVDH